MQGMRIMLPNYKDTILNDNLDEYKKTAAALSTKHKIAHLKFAIDIDSEKIVSFLVNLDDIQILKYPATVISQLRSNQSHFNILEDLYYIYYLSSVAQVNAFSMIKEIQFAEQIVRPEKIINDFLMHHSDKVFDFSILFYCTLHFKNDAVLNAIFSQFELQQLHINHNVRKKINRETLLHVALKKRRDYGCGFDSPIEKLIRLVVFINP